jgi:hypothetical protein
MEMKERSFYHSAASLNLLAEGHMLHEELYYNGTGIDFPNVFMGAQSTLIFRVKTMICR